MAIKDYFSFQLIPVLLDVVVLNHNHHHINFAEELIEVQDLVLHNLLLSEERVEGLEWTGEVALLDVEHLEGGTLANIIHVLLIGEAIKTHAAVIRNPVHFHNLVDALEHEDGLVIVGLHTLVNNLGQLGIVTHKEPGVNRDAVATHTRAGLKDVYTRMHVADLDNLTHVHIVMTADAAEFVGKGDVHSAISVLHHLRHLGRADVGNDNLALAETSII